MVFFIHHLLDDWSARNNAALHSRSINQMYLASSILEGSLDNNSKIEFLVV